MVRKTSLVTDDAGKRLDLNAQLSQGELARMTMDLLQRTFKVCDEALQAAHESASSDPLPPELPQGPLEAFPIGGTGKVLKTELREQFKDYRLPGA